MPEVSEPVVGFTFLYWISDLLMQCVHKFVCVMCVCVLSECVLHLFSFLSSVKEPPKEDLTVSEKFQLVLDVAQKAQVCLLLLLVVVVGYVEYLFKLNLFSPYSTVTANSHILLFPAVCISTESFWKDGRCFGENQKVSNRYT